MRSFLAVFLLLLACNADARDKLTERSGQAGDASGFEETILGKAMVAHQQPPVMMPKAPMEQVRMMPRPQYQVAQLFGIGKPKESLSELKAEERTLKKVEKAEKEEIKIIDQAEKAAESIDPQTPQLKAAEADLLKKEKDLKANLERQDAEIKKLKEEEKKASLLAETTSHQMKVSIAAFVGFAIGSTVTYVLVRARRAAAAGAEPLLAA